MSFDRKIIYIEESSIAQSFELQQEKFSCGVGKDAHPHIWERARMAIPPIYPKERSARGRN
ncbi:hypothetical protein NIES2101_26545 [Calothrix sp. HK-06]|nr:hypothetical protein NIES2101_26545 [Calothrix sp. HK-06]